MPKEEGIVIKVLPHGALVKVKKSDACHSCPSEGLCHMGRSGVREVLARNPINAKPGERVEVQINERLFLKASFIVYLLPVLGLLIGGIIGRWIVLHFLIGFSQDIGALIGGVTMMLIIFLLIKITSTTLSCKERYQPVITKTKNESSGG